MASKWFDASTTTRFCAYIVSPRHAVDDAANGCRKSLLRPHHQVARLIGNPRSSPGTSRPFAQCVWPIAATDTPCAAQNDRLVTIPLCCPFDAMLHPDTAAGLPSSSPSRPGSLRQPSRNRLRPRPPTSRSACPVSAALHSHDSVSRLTGVTVMSLLVVSLAPASDQGLSLLTLCYRATPLCCFHPRLAAKARPRAQKPSRLLRLRSLAGDERRDESSFPPSQLYYVIV